MKFKVLELDPLPLPAVEITLTAEEASVIASITGKIAGDNGTVSPRSFLSKLYNDLKDAGYGTRHGGPVTWKGKKFKFSSGMKVEKL